MIIKGKIEIKSSDYGVHGVEQNRTAKSRRAPVQPRWQATAAEGFRSIGCMSEGTVHFLFAKTLVIKKRLIYLTSCH